MKRQKYTFNQLLLRYNKYRRKLARLIAQNRNAHRQQVLRKHIERLIAQLSELHWKISKKHIATAAFVGAMSIGAQAQTQFKENHINQFNLQAVPTGYTAYLEENVSAADLDNDGDQDILVIGTNGTEYFYYENTGTAAAPDFASPLSNPFNFNPPTGMNYANGSFADVDGDGDYDFFVNQYSYYAASGVQYYENVGTASAPDFANPVTNPFGITTPPSPWSAEPSFVDMDSDGDLDLVLTNISQIQYYENTGTTTAPSFAAPTNLGSGAQEAHMYDIDNDGDYDVVGHIGIGLSFVENTGTSLVPNFVTPVNFAFDLYSTLKTLNGFELLDINADGDQDILYTKEDGKFLFFENVGTASQASFTDGHTDLFGLGADVNHHSLGDIDDDGDLDILVQNNYGFDYYENTGDAMNPNFAGVQVLFSGSYSSGYSIISPTLADIDNDGDLDIFAYGGPGSYGLVFFENTGTASNPNITPGVVNAFGVTQSVLSPAFYDIDNDGDLDLFARNGGNVSYYENTGSAANPSFAPLQLNPFGLPSYTIPNYMTLADIDGDGDADLVAGDQNNNPGFVIAENIGTVSAPQFDTPQTDPYGLRKVSKTGNNNYGNVPKLGDLDGDGDMDILTCVDLPNNRFSFFENISSCAVNTNVTVNGATITASQGNAQYQWVDCDNGNNPISGETNQSFTATVNGNYACIITLPGCSDVSACQSITSLSIDEMNGSNVGIQPNPANEFINVSSEATIERVMIFDLMGNLILESTETNISVSQLSGGTYTISVQTADGMTQKRFVKM